MSSLADAFSGGADTSASNDLEAALTNLQNVNAPTAEALTLPQLQAFVQAGILTPEQAQSYTVGNNAFDTTTADNAGLDTELSTIGQLQSIVNSGGADPEEQANIQSILNTLGTTESGDNAAILANQARSGTANSGLTMAAQLLENQNDATNANTNALSTGAAEEARELAALSEAGTLGGQVQGQQYTQSANQANAANAIAEFNAAQKQQVGNLNTTNANAAQAANLANAQDVANKNTVSAQTQEESIPAAQQQAFNDALEKAGAFTGIAEAQSNQSEQTGQQNAGILGGLVGAAGTVASAELGGNPYSSLASALVQNNNSNGNNVNTGNNSGVQTGSTGGKITPRGIERPVNMKSGGPVPGMADVPGDSPQNDTQLAKLSPGEIVLPRSVTQPQPDASKVMQFLRSLPKPPPQQRQSIHPKAVLDTLRGLSMHHSGAAA